MKKLLVLTVGIMLLALVSNALNIQNVSSNNNFEPSKSDHRMKWQCGVKIGLNYSNVFEPQGEAFNAKYALRFVGGIFFVLPIDKGVGLQPEILFSQKGFKANGNILGSPYSLTRTTNYIDIPLLFSFKLSPEFTLLMGPQYSYLIKQKDVFDVRTISIAQETEFSKDKLRRNMMGFAIGFDTHINHLVLGIRAEWDVLNNLDNTTNTPRYKNALVQATLGYRFYN